MNTYYKFFCNEINRKCAVTNKPVKSNIMLNVTNNKMVITENIINDSTTTIYFMIQITKISRMAI